jgi:hypothetical protein
MCMISSQKGMMRLTDSFVFFVWTLLIHGELRCNDWKIKGKETGWLRHNYVQMWNVLFHLKINP